MPRKPVRARPTRTQQLRDEFVRMIRSGQWSIGRSLPTEMALTDRFNVSRTVVRAALKDLESRGWVKATRGSGRRVTEQARHWRASIGLLVAGGELAGGQGHLFFTRLEDYVTRHNHVLLTHSCRIHEDAPAPDWTVNLDHFDGLIVYAPNYLRESLRSLAQRLPVVCMPHDATAFGVPSFYVDYGMHACRAVQALAERGHRRIGLLLSGKPSRSMINSTIRRGFDMGRTLAQLELGEDVIFTYGTRITPAEVEHVLQALDEPSSPVTALVCRTFASPMQALMEATAARGRNFLARHAVVCLSDLGSEPQPARHLAYFQLPFEQIAQQAVEVLQGMILGRKPDRLHYPHYGQLVGTDQLPVPS